MNTPQSTLPSSQAHPGLDLLARYKAIFAAAWQARHELAGPKRLTDEAAFMPAALSLQETPVHPAPRRAAIAICALFAIALLWAWFGQVDIVAVAPGRIVVSERTKTIQPLEASVVKHVLVRDGDTVQAGQVLVELDPTNAQADQHSVQEQVKAVDAEVQRTATLFDALSTGRPPPFGPSLSKPRSDTAAQLQAEWQDIQARLAKLDAEHTRRSAEAATVREGIVRLEATLPIARQREADLKHLADQGFINQPRLARPQHANALNRSVTWPPSTPAWPRPVPRCTRPSRTRPPTWPKRSARCANARPRPRSNAQQLGQERNKTEQRQRLTQLTAPGARHGAAGGGEHRGRRGDVWQVLMVVVPTRRRGDGRGGGRQQGHRLHPCRPGGRGEARDLSIHALRHGGCAGEAHGGGCGGRREARGDISGHVDVGA